MHLHARARVHDIVLNDNRLLTNCGSYPLTPPWRRVGVVHFDHVGGISGKCDPDGGEGIVAERRD